MAKARPAAEVLPRLIGAKATEELFRRGRGRPPKAARKVNQTIRLDPDVLAAYRQEGRGWQDAHQTPCCVNTCPVTKSKTAIDKWGV